MYECPQCERIKSRLSLDGLISQLRGKSVNKNAEARTIRALYFQPNYERIRRPLNFNVDFYRKVLHELKSRKFCSSVGWLSFRETLPCSHCMRLAIDGVTVEGQVKMYRFQDTDYEFERDTIIRLYKGIGVLETSAGKECVYYNRSVFIS